LRSATARDDFLKKREFFETGKKRGPPDLSRALISVKVKKPPEGNS
jgi:hypothetical protein